MTERSVIEQDVPIVCAGPGPHDPVDGIVGTMRAYAPEGVAPLVDGTRCQAPECQPAPPPEPEIDVAAQLAALQAQLDELAAILKDSA